MACDGCLDDLRALILACTDITSLRGYIAEAMGRLCADRCRGQLTTPGLSPLADPEEATAEAFPEMPSCDCAMLVLHDTDNRMYLSADNGLSWLRYPDTKHNITNTDPTVNDDSSEGYSVGSRWINTTSDNEFVCTDATIGAAIWMPTTNETQVMEVISSGKLGVAAANIDLTAIPQTYHDLVLVLRLRCSAATGSVNLQFNGDAGNNYALQESVFTGTSATTAGVVNQTQAPIARGMTPSTATAGYFATLEIRIPAYYRNDITKLAQYMNSYFTSPTNHEYRVGSIGWENTTDGIDQITLTPASGNFAAGSSWVLYGQGEAV